MTDSSILGWLQSVHGKNGLSKQLKNEQNEKFPSSKIEPYRI